MANIVLNRRPDRERTGITDPFTPTLENWQVPAGLDRSVPRRVALTGSGKAVMVTAILFLVAAAAAIVGLGLVAARQSAKAWQLDKEGMTTSAVVTNTWEQRQGKSKRYWISYRFGAGDRNYEGQATVSRGRWQALHEGSLVQVRYLPSDPEVHGFPGTSSTGDVPFWVPPLIALEFGAVGTAMLIGIRLQRRLLTEGRPAPGIVTWHRRVAAAHGRRANRYGYRFRLLSGALAEGKAGSAKKNPPPEGTPITVVYDPNYPRRNAVFPFSLVRLDENRT